MALAATLSPCAVASAQPADPERQAQAFLDKNRNNWTSGINYWNVPYADGKILHDLIVKGGFRNILEIGTSTGHSTIWLAWAAAKTGGKVSTIEIDQRRHEQALKNIRDAGVEKIITFEFPHFMSPHSCWPSARNLFERYRNWCESDEA